jgi:hypothetical protein
VNPEQIKGGSPKMGVTKALGALGDIEAFY